METDDNVCVSLGSFTNERLLLCCLQLYRSQHFYFHEGRTGSHRYRGNTVFKIYTIKQNIILEMKFRLGFCLLCHLLELFSFTFYLAHYTITSAKEVPSL